MKLYVDDLRSAPEGWLFTRNYDLTVRVLELLPIEALSLDHDLGEGLTGYDVAKWIVEHDVWPKEIWLHTSNPVGRFNMYQLLSHYAPEGVIVHE